MSAIVPVYRKSRLIKELAFRCGIKQVASKQMFEVLADIIKREARNAPVILPGLCKFEVVPRKARRIRNPRTGAQLIMPPQGALKVTPARSVKLAVAPRVPAVPIDQYVPPVVPEPVLTPSAPASVQPSALVEPPKPVEDPKPVAEPLVSAAASAVEKPIELKSTVPAPAIEHPPLVEPAKEAEVLSAVTSIVGSVTETSPASAAAEPPAETPPAEPSAETPPAEPPAETSPAEPPAETPPAETSPAEPVGEQASTVEEPVPEAISFRCPGCSQEIEAPLDAVGLEAECPMCGRIVVVPATSELGTMYGPQSENDGPKNQEVVTAKEAEGMDPAQLKNRTIRIDAAALGFDDPESKATAPVPGAEKMISFFCPNCRQEIETTTDMAGSQAECPQCGTLFEVPFFSEPGTMHYEAPADDAAAEKQNQAQKHSTMRIDLPDDF